MSPQPYTDADDKEKQVLRRMSKQISEIKLKQQKFTPVKRESINR